MRNGRVASRRRRVLLDESQKQDESARRRPRTSRAEEPPAARTYSLQAEAERQARITDCIPTRRFTLGLLAGLLLLTAVGLHSLDLFAKLYCDPSLPSWQFLVLRPGGTLAGWTCSTLLGLAALFSLLTYVLRRHKVDDYHGRYRLWLWITLALGPASVMQTADVIPLYQQLMRDFGFAETKLMSAVTTGLVGLVALLATVRIGFEVRASRLVLTLVVGAGATGLALLALPSITIPVPTLLYDQVLSGLWLVCVMLCLSSSITFARHVYMDSQGMIANAVVETEDRGSVKAEEEEGEAEAAKGRPEEALPRRKSPSSKRKPVVEQPEVEEALTELESDETPRKLSKAERRRQRKQRRQAA